MRESFRLTPVGVQSSLREIRRLIPRFVSRGGRRQRLGLELQVPGHPGARLACGDIVSPHSGCAGSSLRSFVAIAAVVGVFAILGHSAMLLAQSRALRSPDLVSCR